MPDEVSRTFRPATRWSTAVAVPSVAFGVVWWIGQAVFGLDVDAAVGVASAIGAVIGAPLVWWAGRDGLTTDGGGIPAQPVPVRFFDLSDQAQEGEFYNHLALSIESATEEIFRSGRGFIIMRTEHQPYADRLFEAEMKAAANGVQMMRIQTSSQVSEQWAQKAASMREAFGNWRMFADFDEPSFVNVGIIDPHGHSPVIQLLFETAEPTIQGVGARAACALFIYGQRPLAQSLAKQMLEAIKALRQLEPDDIRALSATPDVYFAYGSNMSLAHLQGRVPDARRLGPAVLYGWERTFAVAAPHLGGSAAGIRPSTDPTKYVAGVAYRMTEEGKRSLDDIEKGGYTPRNVTIKIGNHHVAAYAHVPNSLTGTLPPPLPYVDIMIEGARENAITELVDELITVRDGLTSG